MYRNFHGSGEVDAEFDDICEGASGQQYRITVNSTQKKLPHRRKAKCPISTWRSIIYGAIEFEGPQAPGTPQPKRASCGNLTLARSNISLRTVEAIKIGKKRVSRRQPMDGRKS